MDKLLDDVLQPDLRVVFCGTALGTHSAAVGPSRVFVLPSTSGAARRYWDISLWHRLAETLLT